MIIFCKKKKSYNDVVFNLQLFKHLYNLNINTNSNNVFRMKNETTNVSTFISMIYVSEVINNLKLTMT